MIYRLFKLYIILKIRKLFLLRRGTLVAEWLENALNTIPKIIVTWVISFSILGCGRKWLGSFEITDLHTKASFALIKIIIFFL